MKSRVIKATINHICKWRVYFAGELLATFESEQDARDYAKFINESEQDARDYAKFINEQ